MPPVPQSVNEKLTGWPRRCIDKYHIAKKIFVPGVAAESRHDRQGAIRKRPLVSEVLHRHFKNSNWQDIGRKDARLRAGHLRTD